MNIVSANFTMPCVEHRGIKIYDDASPIVLFVYNRPLHTRQTVESLPKNELAQEFMIFLTSSLVFERKEMQRSIVGMGK